MFTKTRININNVVVYNQKKRPEQNRSALFPFSSVSWCQPAILDQVVNKLDEPKQLTDKDGLHKAYRANADIAIFDDSLYIAITKIQRESDIYDDVANISTLGNV